MQIVNCPEFEEIIRDLSRSEAQQPSDGARMNVISAGGAAHARACRPCAARLAEERHLNAALSALSHADLHLNPSAHVESNLRAAFRQKYAGRRPWRTAFWLGPIYAGGVAVLAVFFIVNHARQTPATPPVLAQISGPASGSASGLSAGTVSRPTAGNVQPSGNLTPATPDDANPRVANSAPAAATSSAPAQSAESAADSFILLPYSDGLSPAESAAVVRVTLSESALSSWGLSAPADAISDNGALADLVVGEDGTPRAVHFVRDED